MHSAASSQEPAGDKLAQLEADNADLRIRLQEAEETLAAIRHGEVDALVVGEDIYTLDSSSAAANKLRMDVLAQMDDAVLAFDRQERVIFVNGAAQRRYGHNLSSALGRHKREILREVSSGNPLALEGAAPNNQIHLLPEGHQLNVEVSVSPLRDSEGMESGQLYVIRDIDARVRAERALAATAAELAQRERQFSTLVENSPDIFARLDRQHRHLYVSPIISHYTGRSAGEFLGLTNAQLGMPPELCQQWDNVLDEVFASRESRVHQFNFTLATGEEAVFHCRLIPEFDALGQVESVLSIAVNVTDQEKVNAALKESQARLEEADVRKDEFLATLAHELRNPLAPIRNALQIMRLTQVPERQASARNIIDRQLTQMVRLVDDLLDVSRISRGKMELRREVADLALIVQSAVETSRPLIEAGRHELTLQLPLPRSLLVYGDVTRLCQVVSNLLNNAAKYTQEGGHIEVIAHRVDDEAVVTVRDNGIGIPPLMLPRVFDMFTQVERSASRAQGGLGIGLALVRQLIDLHGGRVGAASGGPGTGSTFTIHLPLSPKAIDDEQQIADLRAEPPSDCRVLVVDDNVDSAQSMAHMLEMLGYCTEVAHDGCEALGKAATFKPRIVVLDIGLPLLSGHDVARRLRANPAVGDILLVALSGWGQEGDKEKSRQAGFDHHFVKPVELGELLRVIATAHVHR